MIKEFRNIHEDVKVRYRDLLLQAGTDEKLVHSIYMEMVNAEIDAKIDAAG